MLGKLLKYDLKWNYKILIIFYILALILAILTRVLLNIENSLLFSVLGKIVNGAMIAMLINALVNGVIRSWIRFIQSVFKDESYLTHTLPVEKSSIFLSKVLMAIITTFTTVILAIVCLFISYYSQANMEVLKNLLKLTATTYDISVIVLLLIVAAVIFLEVVFILLIGYASIIIGHRSNINKMSKSFALGIFLYLATSTFTLLVVYIIGLFNEGVMNVINTTEIVNVQAIKSIMLIGMVVYVIYNIIYYWIGVSVFKKGVNVD